MEIIYAPCKNTLLYIGYLNGDLIMAWDIYYLIYQNKEQYDNLLGIRPSFCWENINFWHFFTDFWKYFIFSYIILLNGELAIALDIYYQILYKYGLWLRWIWNYNDPRWEVISTEDGVRGRYYFSPRVIIISYPPTTKVLIYYIR